MKFKQVIIIRKDLKMSSGKIISQACHASLEAYRRAGEGDKKAWEDEGAKKVVVKVPDLKSLLEIQEKARKMKLPHALIKDAGRTELPPGTVTALAIGPSPSKDIDRVTKDLKLL